ncbi:MAG: hypothetical protein R6U11_04620 [Bacteroidales bacterium]
MSYTKDIYDKLKALIKSEFPRFKDADRIRVTDQNMGLKESDLGYEDFILIRFNGVIDEQQMTNEGKLETQEYQLIYVKRIIRSEQIDEIANFYDSLDSLLTSNNSCEYWYNLLTLIDTEMDIETPEDYQGELSGFVMTLEISVGKF